MTLEPSQYKSSRKHFSASVSAGVLYALTPMIRAASELAHSDRAFFNQIDTRLLGCYLLPAEKGVVACAVHGSAMLAIFDAEGDASEPLKVNFPEGLLDVLVPRTVTLRDENGMPFEVESEPKAHRILCVDGFGMVFPDKAQQEKHEGCFGTWFNGDHGNYRDDNTYRAESADISFLAKAINRPQVEGVPPNATILNPHLLDPIAEAAKRMGVALEFTLRAGGEAIVVRSAHGESDVIYGLLMPMAGEHRGPSPLIDILSGKDKAATASA